MADQSVLVCTEDQERLDRFLARQLQDVSRAEIQRWIQDGAATVNGRLVKASHRLSIGDRVVVIVPEAEPAVLEAREMPLHVVYEDPDCVVIDKPPGLVVHPATSHQQDTLVNALLMRYPEMIEMVDLDTPAGRRPGVVHRLDKDTSGLLVVARHEQARQILQRQFKTRQVQKTYVALLYGRLSEPEGRIVAPIGRDPKNRQRMDVVADGRQAVTEYRVQQYLSEPHGHRELYTLIEAHPVTGRTHQIRVHFCHIGHPVVCDRIYGRRKRGIACPRQFLHATRLEFHRPGDGEWMVFQSPLPEDLQRVLSRLEPVT